MAFIESRLLTKVNYGIRGGPRFQTDIVTVRSNHESRNQNWSQAQHMYELGLCVRKKSEFAAIENAFMAARGRLDGFRWKDWADYQTTTSTGVLIGLHGSVEVGTAGVGYGTPVYQLGKIYTAGGVTYARHIRKPAATPVPALRRGGVAMVAGASAGQYALVTTTGLVTVVADQSKAISSHTIGATHVFTLASAFSPNLAIGGRIYVTGVTGTAATTLNDLSHAITGVSSAVITTSTVTTGLTASGGTAYFYPQPTETLDWTGEFDVPVRFEVDEFEAVIVNKQAAGELLLEMPSVRLIEIRT